MIAQSNGGDQKYFRSIAFDAYNFITVQRSVPSPSVIEFEVDRLASLNRNDIREVHEFGVDAHDLHPT
jgi:hypothetical protein